MRAGGIEALRRAVAPLLLASTLLGACADAGPVSRDVSVRMRYSRYLPASLQVRAGDAINFTLINGDPIGHEFIIGTAAEQDAHKRGSIDDVHDGPGEASIPPNGTQRLTFTFSKPGTFLYGCHLPGHYAYGMKGTVRVTE